MARKKRALTENEQQLWNKVIKQVETIEAMPPLIITAPPKPTKTPKVETPREIKPFKIGSKAKPKPATPSAPSFVDRPNQTSPNMDRRNFQRLLKGQLEIDATLDLHGLTADQARMQLQIFIQNANRMGNRLLLIITGKGNKKTIDEFGRPRSGVLRSGVPEWLKNSDAVLQVTQAHGKHGGGGAYYVYLRRKRS
ncbi:Smr/MutS family protein [Amylibacter sp. IMCC11727]|uniref:Smr/MutS family protein n=1 Tax=Amylibacter sp. IMCC11727 TaxID=3039851 RepID=UPI00244D9DA6|nr:Smr/MutS family protein [Amylibacter sp. IMCC11727]WGI22044.1 Smr/MutS family protein [Amylibacter sp. IMCC11727]